MANSVVNVNGSGLLTGKEPREVETGAWVLDTNGDGAAIDVRGYRQISLSFRRSDNTATFSIQVFDSDGATKYGDINGGAFTTEGVYVFPGHYDRLIPTVGSVSAGTVTVTVKGS